MPDTSFVHRQRERFLRWWRAPVTRRDRVLGAFVGGFGGFWVGILALLVTASGSVSGTALLWSAGVAVLAGLLLGILFPKAISVVLFPFSTFGVGGGS